MTYKTKQPAPLSRRRYAYLIMGVLETGACLLAFFSIYVRPCMYPWHRLYPVS
jgi:hypothetical protein